MKSKPLPVILCIVFFLPLSGLCQNNDSLFKRASIGISYEPGIHYRQLNYDATTRWLRTIRNADEVPKYGFSLGLNFKYRLNRLFTVEIGLSVANKGMKTRKTNLLWEEPNEQYPIKSQAKFSFYFADIPLKLNCNFQIRKMKFYGFTGLSLNNFINKETTHIVYFSNGNKSKTVSKQGWGYQSNSYTVILGFGFNFRLSKRFFLSVEPTYRQGIVSVVEQRNAREYLYSIGLNTKLFYHFIKRMN